MFLSVTLCSKNTEIDHGGGRRRGCFWRRYYVGKNLIFNVLNQKAFIGLCILSSLLKPLQHLVGCVCGLGGNYVLIQCWWWIWCFWWGWLMCWTEGLVGALLLFESYSLNSQVPLLVRKGFCVVAGSPPPPGAVVVLLSISPVFLPDCFTAPVWGLSPTNTAHIVSVCVSGSECYYITKAFAQHKPNQQDEK